MKVKQAENLRIYLNKHDEARATLEVVILVSLKAMHLGNNIFDFNAYGIKT